MTKTHYLKAGLSRQLTELRDSPLAKFLNAVGDRRWIELSQSIGKDAFTAHEFNNLSSRQRNGLGQAIAASKLFEEKGIRLDRTPATNFFLLKPFIEKVLSVPLKPSHYFNVERDRYPDAEFFDEIIEIGSVDGTPLVQVGRDVDGVLVARVDSFRLTPVPLHELVKFSQDDDLVVDSKKIRKVRR